MGGLPSTGHKGEERWGEIEGGRGHVLENEGCKVVSWLLRFLVLFFMYIYKVSTSGSCFIVCSCLVLKRGCVTEG